MVLRKVSGSSWPLSTNMLRLLVATTVCDKLCQLSSGMSVRRAHLVYSTSTFGEPSLLSSGEGDPLPLSGEDGGETL